MRKAFIGLASAAALAGGLGVASLGLSTGVAQAAPQFAPAYHWCPGDFWDPGWGDNWEWGGCHDDHHRDWDGDDHSRDFWRDGGDHRGDHWGDRGDNHWGDRGPWWPH
jgi:hypothetical protein